jgi:hypothetical protein
MLGSIFREGLLAFRNANQLSEIVYTSDQSTFEQISPLIGRICVHKHGAYM